MPVVPDRLIERIGAWILVFDVIVLKITFAPARNLPRKIGSNSDATLLVKIKLHTSQNVGGNRKMVSGEQIRSKIASITRRELPIRGMLLQCAFVIRQNHHRSISHD